MQLTQKKLRIESRIYELVELYRKTKRNYELSLLLNEIAHKMS